MSTELQERVRAAFLGLAVCDALGAPLEFQARRNPDNYETNMVPNDNFGLPKGHFTDDTSMALCLASSLINGSNPVDQALKYIAWLNEGYMSSVPGPAFDVGIQTRGTLRIWQDDPRRSTLDIIAEKFSRDRNCGNGSLMRVLSCALIAKSEEEAMNLAAESSLVTHPHPRCVDACRIYCRLVFHALRGTSKSDLLNLIQPTDSALRERLVDFVDKPRSSISSSGYVVHSLEAALWAFFNSDTFEKGAIEVVNLGDDADTVGAIYGGLAGAFYKEIPQRWLADMQQLDLVEEASKPILALVL